MLDLSSIYVKNQRENVSTMKGELLMVKKIILCLSLTLLMLTSLVTSTFALTARSEERMSPLFQKSAGGLLQLCTVYDPNRWANEIRLLLQQPCFRRNRWLYLLAKKHTGKWRLGLGRWECCVWPITGRVGSMSCLRPRHYQGRIFLQWPHLHLGNDVFGGCTMGLQCQSNRDSICWFYWRPLGKVFTKSHYHRTKYDILGCRAGFDDLVGSVWAYSDHLSL